MCAERRLRIEVKNKKRAALIAAAAVSAVILTAFSFVQSKRKAEFPSETKSSVAMGTVLTVRVYSENAEAHINNVKEAVLAAENAVSWRIENSPAAVLNKNGRVKNEALAAVLKICAEVSERSGGKFDVSVGKLSELWDFDSGKAVVPAKSDINKALSTVGYEKIKLSGSLITAEKGQKIDLGAVGKGLACDAAAEYLKKAGVNGATVAVGGSIAVLGKRNEAGDKWRVAVRDPKNENGFLGVILLDEGFVSTSGDYEKYFEKDGKRYHHILNAKTGYPAESGLLSVTVVSESGLLSDALSTACFILGLDEGKKLAEGFGASALFVTSDGKTETVGDVDFEAVK